MTKIEKRNLHLNAIAKAFGGWKNPETNLETIWRSWRRYEAKATRLAIIYCGDGNYNQEKRSKRAEIELDALDTLLRNKFSKLFKHNKKFTELFFINKDPRGYALKINQKNTPFGCHTDWGGYTILAPDELA